MAAKLRGECDQVIRFKAFSGADASTLERQVNDWLARAEPDVKMMDQSPSANGGIVVSFLYDEGFLASENRLTDEASAIVEHALREEPILEPIQVDQEQV